ncbi:hypothetical protein QFZ32_009297 [Streptomyces canus]|uniref:Uncharacterized protein n=1 Tax=Streptomyces canus TaxID=58343 RepID=A0AAW8FWY4_9ACTN|nr:hypothetical protein [Streptomyces canus]MDQ1073769.1 hypothetical protein [Streptomyces canus]
MSAAPALPAVRATQQKLSPRQLLDGASSLSTQGTQSRSVQHRNDHSDTSGNRSHRAPLEPARRTPLPTPTPHAPPCHPAPGTPLPGRLSGPGCAPREMPSVRRRPAHRSDQEGRGRLSVAHASDPHPDAACTAAAREVASAAIFEAVQDQGQSGRPDQRGAGETGHGTVGAARLQPPGRDGRGDPHRGERAPPTWKATPSANRSSRAGMSPSPKRAKTRRQRHGAGRGGDGAHGGSVLSGAWCGWDGACARRQA